MIGRTWRKPAENTKSGKRHTIPLSVEAIAELAKLPRHNSSDLLFRNSAGNAWSEVAAWPAIRRAAALDGVRIHDLRHSAASLMVSAGLSLETIGAVLGHSTPAMTSRYSHLHDHAVRAAMGQLGKAIAAAADD
jgi:integrase